MAIKIEYFRKHIVDAALRKGSEPMMKIMLLPLLTSLLIGLRHLC